MKRSEAIAIARMAAAAQPEGYMNPENANVFEPHEWVLTAIIAAANNASAYTAPPPTEEPEDVRGHVLAMRNFFLTMVAGYNAVGAYDSARDAQAMAIVLHKFEDDHNVTGLAWPLEVIREEGNSPGLKTVYEGDNVRYGEDL